MVTIPSKFRDSSYEYVPYDGSPVAWRPSVYGLCIVNDSVLLVKHRDEKFWDIPGGGVELDESLEAALIRESKEEAGWELSLVQPLFTLTDWFYHRDEKRYYKTLQLYYLATGEKVLDKPLDKRIEDVQLVELNQVETLTVYPNVLRALDEIKKFNVG